MQLFIRNQIRDADRSLFRLKVVKFRRKCGVVGPAGAALIGAMDVGFDGMICRFLATAMTDGKVTEMPRV